MRKRRAAPSRPPPRRGGGEITPSPLVGRVGVGIARPWGRSVGAALLPAGQEESVRLQKLIKRRGCAEQGRPGAVDHPDRNIAQIRRGAPFVFEALAERGMPKEVAQPRHDAAADIHPAARSQGNGQIGRHRAQQGAEQRHCVVAQRVAAVQGQAGDFGGAALGRRLPGDLSERLMQKRHPGAAQQTLGRNMPEARMRQTPDGHLALIKRGEAHMPTLARKRRPTPLSVGNQARHAQAGARAQQRQRRAGHGAAAAHLNELGRGQFGQGAREHSEVVEHQKGLQPQLGAGLGDGKGPVMVGHANLVAIHRVGDADGDMAHGGRARGGEIGEQRIGKAGVIRRGQHANIAEPLRGVQGESGIGAADVADQAGGRKGEIRGHLGGVL